MQPASNTFLRLVSKALRVSYDKVANEPLPQRWVDLIHHLNERERAEADQHRQYERPGRANPLI